MTTAPAAMSAAPSAPTQTPSASTSAAPATSSTPPSGGSAPSQSSGSSSSSAPQGGVSGGGDPGAKHIAGLGQQPTESAPQGDKAAAVAEAARQEQIRKMKLKVTGRDVEMDVAEVFRRAQLASGADEKFRDASDLRKQATQLVEALRANPLDVLGKLGVDVREFTENYLAKELQREMLSPEQRELQELREWRQQQQAAQESAQKEQMTRAQQQEMAKLQQRAAQEYDTKITEVLSQSNVPKTAYTVKRVAELLMGALQKGYDLDVNTAVDMVREGYTTDLQSMVGGLDGEPLVKFLGPELLKKLRKYDLGQLKAKMQPAQPTVPQESAPIGGHSRGEPQQKMLRQEEWKEMIRKKAGL